jgi:hypothetical protein
VKKLLITEQKVIIEKTKTVAKLHFLVNMKFLSDFKLI